MNVNVCILDYGNGNVRSISNMLSRLDIPNKISNLELDLESSSHLILPGVGAFKYAMSKILGQIPIEILKNQVFNKKKPFLGICVGMQVLFESSDEFGFTPGLSWIDGKITKLASKNQPLPHIGWNEVYNVITSELTNNINSEDFYFVHSFGLTNVKNKYSISITNYGNDFSSIVKLNNICGVQFHPEKSQKAGETLIKNFIQLR